MADESEVLFERIGGAAVVADIVKDMYRRVLADEDLAGFFENTSMERLQKMQFEFLASAFDGPVKYCGTELAAIHHGRGITGQHFAKFCNHFADAMESHGVDAKDIDDAMGRLAMYKDKITGDVGVDG
ncbi:group I truncated hemoglobin [Roseimaritima ulvae]|uniref:Group 1 truncated hemoglobin GlbN n=1 Tax=Roseimaritima ulvae TaxID=980254 RepID=A0A5B9QWI9_9BACT|nr:group 1 truncated hemoglobin [Roseimaritima ulvae]QEG43377.1 Group 1 truncated hemoglobin GlbN [Roseimaritima ulvae]